MPILHFEVSAGQGRAAVFSVNFLTKTPATFSNCVRLSWLSGIPARWGWVLGCVGLWRTTRGSEGVIWGFWGAAGWNPRQIEADRSETRQCVVYSGRQKCRRGNSR